MNRQDQTMLSKAISHSDILPAGQKNTLSIICSSEYPISAKKIEKAASFSRQAVNFSLKALLSRNFIERERDGVFVYKINQDRAIELIERYKTSLLTDK